MYIYIFNDISKVGYVMVNNFLLLKHYMVLLQVDLLQVIITIRC